MALLGRLKLVELKIEEDDKKVWVASLDGLFSVRSCALLFGRYATNLSLWKAIWFSPVPPKVQFFMWTVSLGMIQMIDLH